VLKIRYWMQFATSLLFDQFISRPRSEVTRHSGHRSRLEHDAEPAGTIGHTKPIPRLRSPNLLHPRDRRRSRTGSPEVTGTTGCATDDRHPVFPAKRSCRHGRSEDERDSREVHRRVWRDRGPASVDMTVIINKTKQTNKNYYYYL
jgi:hypothetical protein